MAYSPNNPNYFGITPQMYAQMRARRQDMKHPEIGWRDSINQGTGLTLQDLQGMIPGYGQLSAQGPQWADILARGYQGQGAPDMSQLSGMGVNEQTLGPGFSMQDARAWGIDPAEMLQHFGAGAQVGQGNEFYRQMTASPTFALNQAAAGQAQNTLMQQLGKQNMGGQTGANAAAMAAARSAGSRLRMQNRAGAYDSAMQRGSDTVGSMLSPWAASRMAGQQGLMDQVQARMKALAEGRMNTQNLFGEVGMNNQRLMAQGAMNNQNLWAESLNNARQLGAQGGWHTADLWAGNKATEYGGRNDYYSTLAQLKAQKQPWWKTVLGGLGGAAVAYGAVKGGKK